jgi:hypothetical protein
MKILVIEEGNLVARFPISEGSVIFFRQRGLIKPSEGADSPEVFLMPGIATTDVGRLIIALYISREYCK